MPFVVLRLPALVALVGPGPSGRAGVSVEDAAAAVVLAVEGSAEGTFTIAIAPRGSMAMCQLVPHAASGGLGARLRS